MKHNRKPLKTEKCGYSDCCYLAEALDCFGYMSDCTLYLKSNGRFYSRKAFDKAVDKLIDKTKIKHESLSSR